MKRFLLLLALFLGCTVTWAAGLWTPTMTSGETSTPLYVKIYVNGVHTTSGLEVAAFVDGECRADAKTANQLGNSSYLLRVWGTSADKANAKTITIKAFYKNIVYVFTTTQVFDGETDTHSVPLELYLDEVMGFSLPDINEALLPTALPFTRNLAETITINYDEVNRQNKSTVETEFDYSWDNSYAPALLQMAGHVLTVPNYTADDGVTLGLTVRGTEYNLGAAGKKQYSFTTSCNVKVVELQVPVTSLSISPKKITAHIGDNFQTKITELVTVTVLPGNASNPYWTATVKTGSGAGFDGNTITAAGTWTVVISSNENPAIKDELTIYVPRPVSFKIPATLNLSKLGTVTASFTDLINDNNEYDKNLIAITFSNATNGQPCATASMADDTGLNWAVDGQFVGSYTYQVTYNGTPMLVAGSTDVTTGSVHIPAEITFNNDGWDWISLYAYQASKASFALQEGGAYLDRWNEDADNKLIEIRSMTALLYNDSHWGFIGDITELSPEAGMYKVKAKYDDASKCIINMGYDCVLANPLTVNTIQKGYTWISYPLETSTTIAETQLATTAMAGDKIIGHNSFAEFKSGTGWVPADFALEAGKGYIYYTTGDGGFHPDFSAPAGGGVKQFAPSTLNSKPSTLNSTPSPWKYKKGQFADNMPVVAALEGVEDGSRFIIGAYVGDECRGEGQAVDGNIFMISVGGKAGELVHFRLYDKVTEEILDLDQSLIYTSMHGSLRAPVKLSGIGVVDRIGSIHHSPFTIDSSEDVYNLSGQKVHKNFRGIIVKNGRKVVK